MRDLLIFDCDGTLVDTLHDVALCFNQALEDNGFPSYPIEAYGSFVGGNLEQIVSRLLPPDSVTAENVNKVKLAYRALYSKSQKPHTIPFSGIKEALAALRAKGYAIAVNTNKGQALAEQLLHEVFLADTFDTIVGYDEARPSKPDPYGVNLICSELGHHLSEAIYIGDGMSDLLTAKEASIPFVLAAWGSVDVSLETSEDVTHISKEPADLVNVIEAINGVS